MLRRRDDFATVSREHFSIEHNNGKFFLVDLGSVNGTRVNDERVSWVELDDGDTIQAGPYILSFQANDSQGTEAGERAPQQGESSVVARHRGFTEEHGKLYPRQYLEGIEHFNERRYFDAHEVWEEIWLHASDQTKLFYQMLIQAAVALHHHERANMRGASGMYQNVLSKLERFPPTYMSIDLVEFARQLKIYFSELGQAVRGQEDAAEKPGPVIHLIEFDGDTGEAPIRWE